MIQGNAFIGINRTSMPQIDNVLGLLELLDVASISYKIIEHDPYDLKPTQDLLDPRKIKDIADNIKDGIKIDPIVISTELMVIDGHHRWAAAKELGRRSITTIELSLRWDEALSWLSRI